MKLPPERPLSLAACFALIRAIKFVVPAGERAHFESDWEQKCFHRWQFLRFSDLWSAREAAKLLVQVTGAIPEALQHFAAQEKVRHGVSRFVQSPFTCLGLLASLFFLIVGLSHGLPAARDLLFKRVDRGKTKLVYVWTHNVRGGGDRPLPAEVIEAWRTHSRLIANAAAAFRAVHRDVQLDHGPSSRQLIVTTEPSFFDVHQVTPIVGAVRTGDSSVLLSYDAWVQLFRAAPRVLGSKVGINGTWYRINGILPPEFKPLSEGPVLYVVQPKYYGSDAYGVIALKSGVNEKALDTEFTDIAEGVTYYFLNGQLRYGFAQSLLYTPVRSFLIGLMCSALTLLMVFRMKWRAFWPAAGDGKAWARRTGFYLAKTGLGLLCVFTACLEWSRSGSSILFGNFDPATGPFLCWLFIVGTMGVLFWSALDQKARCRECLQLLAFPVRMGCPGCMLLDWSGTEFCCTEGHGVLHVPHLAPSWAEESDHWIALDDSWKSIFGREDGH